MILRRWKRCTIIVRNEKCACNYMNKNKLLVRKGGFEPPRLSAPPPQDGVSASSTTSALESIVYKDSRNLKSLQVSSLTYCFTKISFSVCKHNKHCTRYCTHILNFNPRQVNSTLEWATRQSLRTRKLRVIYGDILRNLEQMDVQRSIRPGNNQVQRNLNALECFECTVVDLGGM